MTQRVSLHYAAVPAQRQESLERHWLARLPPAKRAAVERLRDPQDRNATLLGLALLAGALRARGLEDSLAGLSFPRHQKPTLPGGVDFSISHGVGLVACALVTDGGVGLDLERTGAVGEATVRRVLGEGERDRLAAGTLSPTDAWVMKEAVIKLFGRGLAELGAVRLEGAHAELEGRAAWLTAVALAPGYTAWLATDGAAPGLDIVAAAPGAVDPLPAAR